MAAAALLAPDHGARRGLGRRWTRWWLVLAVLPCLARALDADRAMADYHLTAWTVRDGAPSEIWRMAQTTDGWLWLATPTGLQRFDGVRFERFEPAAGQALLSNSISTLRACANGDLWIGYLYGGASRLREGQLLHVPPGPQQASSARWIDTDADGVVWALFGGTLLRLAKGVWMPPDPSLGLPQASYGNYLGSDGAFWLSAGGRLLHRQPGQARFADSGVAADAQTWIIEAPDRTRWLFAAGALAPMAPPWDLPVAAVATTTTKPFSTSSATLFDRDGNLWSAYCALGVCRLPRAMQARQTIALPADPAPRDRLAAVEGLAGDIASTILEDREGSIWVATRGGLNRLRQTSVVRAALPAGAANFMLAQDPAGPVWVSTYETAGGRSWRLEDPPVQVDAPAPNLSALSFDPAGRLWFGGSAQLWFRDGDRTQQLPYPADVSAADNNAVFAIAHDGTGSWVRFATAGLRRFEQGQWSAADAWQGQWQLPGARPSVLKVDAQGRSWFGFRDNRLAVLEGGRTTVYSAADGLDVGTVLAILPGRQLLVSGDQAVAWFDGARFHTLQAADPDWLQGVTGMVEDADGQVWLNGGRGLVRIAATGFKRAGDDPSQRLDLQLFDFNDGYPGVAQAWPKVPTALAGVDGRLWFASTGGLAWVDPQRLQHNTVIPPVHIRSLQVGEVRIAASTPDIQLPAGTTGLQIDYTALSLAIPERVRFRYRLSGVDANWQEVGTRRLAIYTNLGPGDYRFDVTAANDSGLWNPVGDQLRFAITPRFTQTALFIVLCVAGAGLLLWLAWLLRLRQVSAQIRARVHARLDERERIARELHDTLLQGVQGLMLRFQVGVDQLPADAPARRTLEAALDRADEVLDEGRERVLDLRSRAEAEEDLAVRLRQLGVELAADWPDVQFVVTDHRRGRELDPQVRDEACRSTREAVRNAFRHASARHITVTLDDPPEGLCIRVHDDGAGIDPHVLARRGKPGHFGLAGMHERIAGIGGELVVQRLEDGGTEVRLKVPAQRAYR